MAEFRADAVVVGAGPAGLWTAKSIIDQGLAMDRAVAVDVIERAPTIGSGAVVMNEGWLHNGGYHSHAIFDEEQARTVTARTMMGHEYIANFAPECIDHDVTFALFSADASRDYIDSALARWQAFGVQHKEVSPQILSDDGLDANLIAAAYRVEDKSINTRTLLKSLATYVIDNGGRIFTSAETTPLNSSTAEVAMDGERHIFRAGAFVVAAGTGSKKLMQGVNSEVGLRNFKSHLLIGHRMTRDNFYFNGAYEPGVMGHGNASIVGINRDAVEVKEPDHEIDHTTGKTLHDNLTRVLPAAKYLAYGSRIVPVSCVKVDIAPVASAQPSQMVSPHGEYRKQDLNIHAMEVAEGWYLAVPGKMTETPMLGRLASALVMARLTNLEIGVERRELVGNRDPLVSTRPVDEWISANPADGAITVPLRVPSKLQLAAYMAC